MSPAYPLFRPKRDLTIDAMKVRANRVGGKFREKPIAGIEHRKFEVTGRVAILAVSQEKHRAGVSDQPAGEKLAPDLFAECK